MTRRITHNRWYAQPQVPAVLWLTLAVAGCAAEDRTALGAGDRGVDPGSLADAGSSGGPIDDAGLNPVAGDDGGRGVDPAADAGVPRVSDTGVGTADQRAWPDSTSPGLLFFDDFEYVVSREAQPGVDGLNNAFVGEGGWTYVKSVQFGRVGAKGYLYTATSIPGATEAQPGRSSQRVLVLEARPRSMYDPTDPNSVPQTDFYLQYGNPEGGVADALPGNVWFQFWLYVNHYDDPADQNDQLSLFDGNFKMIYPCNANYPCTEGNLNWLFSMSSGDIMLPEGTAPLGATSHLFMSTAGSGAVYSAVPSWNAWKLGQNVDSTPIRSNQWTLVKLHFDTSSVASSYEAWIRRPGSAWIQVADWHDTLTEDFSWLVPRAGGHRGFRMPTTMGHGTNTRVDRTYDTWMYLDDFSIATNEAALPDYR